MIKRYGKSPESGRQYTRRPGVYAVLLSERGLLLTHQAEPVPEFQLPGGGIDAGEHPIAALHREVMEETGWHISTPKRLGAFRRFTFMPDYNLWAEKLCTVYVARPSLRIGEPTEPGHRALWMNPHQALGLLGNDGDRAMLTLALDQLDRGNRR